MNRNVNRKVKQKGEVGGEKGSEMTPDDWVVVIGHRANSRQIEGRDELLKKLLKILPRNRTVVRRMPCGLGGNNVLCEGVSMCVNIFVSIRVCVRCLCMCAYVSVCGSLYVCMICVAFHTRTNN